MAIEIIPRSEWGAAQPRRRTKLRPDRLDGVAVHWFGRPRAAADHAGCPDLLRRVQQAHLNDPRERYADIAYNHAACPHGIAYELRGYGVCAGANGYGAANRSHAAIVYMAGTGDPLTHDGQHALAALIRAWQERGAGLDVQPHSHFTGTSCPGPEISTWLPQRPWERGGRPSAADETPDWLLDFVEWRLVGGADPATRPLAAPGRIPRSAWEAASRIHRIVNLMGPQEPFLDWLEWRADGARAAHRPQSLPALIPRSWWRARRRIERLEPPPTLF
ncbi:MAG: hypothetical protein H0V68_12130 [Actinobacteria bacterium]|nr:hypothetical protein [Actinomycetota bacterium]